MILKLPPYGKRDLTPAVVDRLKQEAKKLKKKSNVKARAEAAKISPQRLALNLVAIREGHKDWNTLDRAHQRYLSLAPVVNDPSLSFIRSDEFDWTDNEIAKFLGEERSEDISDKEKLIVASNRAMLAELGIEYAIFEPTKTGLKKSILDATQIVRTYFELTEFHEYEYQNQGPEFKIIKDAYFVSLDSTKKSKVSLYRPKTKQGDPRMWFKGLGDFAPATSQVAIVVHNGCAYLINLSQTNIRNSLGGPNELSHFIRGYQLVNNSVSDELLAKIRDIAKAPIKAINKGDTAIGMALENALGIPANSSKKPDYKGIELKAGRSPKNRSNLFAQVANWKLSSCKSSREILDRYGYLRDDGATGLYCTISSLKPNSQGLKFNYVESNDELHEVDKNSNNVAVWTGDLLRKRLKEKHSETFWVDAESVWIDEIEHFNLKSITHTKSPLLGQLMPLIQSGVIK